MIQDEKHPIAAGVIALVVVGLAVGLLLGLFSLVGTRVIGLGGSSGDDRAIDSGPSLYLPSLQPTDTPSGPLVTLAPGESPSPQSTKPAAPKTSRPAKRISLQAGTDAVGSMGRIDLTGVYPGGEGAVLQVQRLDGGHWEDFPVTAAVSGGTFSTYVQTGRSGLQQFRVRDTDSGKVSNVVKVTVG